MYIQSITLCDNYHLSLHVGILLCVCVCGGGRLAEWAMLINEQTGSGYKHMSYN